MVHLDTDCHRIIGKIKAVMLTGRLYRFGPWKKNVNFHFPEGSTVRPNWKKS